VVVQIGAPVVADGAPGMAGLRDETQSDQALEGAVDRGARDAGTAYLRRGVDLLGVGMAVEVENDLEDRAALRGQRNAPLPAELPELLEATRLRPVVHIGERTSLTTPGARRLR